MDKVGRLLAEWGRVWLRDVKARGADSCSAVVTGGKSGGLINGTAEEQGVDRCRRSAPSQIGLREGFDNEWRWRKGAMWLWQFEERLVEVPAVQS